MGSFRPEQTVLSILAGATLKTLREGLDHEALVRVMPNTPAQIGEGMTVWTSTPAVSDEASSNSQGSTGSAR